MATKLKSFTFGPAGGGAPKYPWNDWTDGSIWKAVAGKDFDCEIKSFRTGLHVKASGIERRVRTEVVDDGEAVVFQFLQ